jgi:hypothetical protein
MNVTDVSVFMWNTLRRRVITRRSSSSSSSSASSAYLNIVSHVRKWPSRATNSITKFRRYPNRTRSNRSPADGYLCNSSSRWTTSYTKLYEMVFFHHITVLSTVFVFSNEVFFFFVKVYRSVQWNDTIDVCKIKIGTSLEGEDASLANNCWPAIR